jgi:hypothetical protein
LAFFHDTLFYASAIDPFADGTNTNHVGKFIGSSYADTCGLPVGLIDARSAEMGVQLHPNPATAHIELSGCTITDVVQILDATGRVMSTMVLRLGSRINVEWLGPGCYFVRVLDKSGVFRASLRFIKE